MGIDYTAYLFYGIQLPEDFTNLVYSDKYEYDWEKWLAEKLEVKYWSEEYKKAVNELGITLVVTSILGKYPVHYLALADTFHAGYYSPTKFDMPTWDNDAMLQKMGAACDRLGFEYTEPKWILVINVS